MRIGSGNGIQSSGYQPMEGAGGGKQDGQLKALQKQIDNVKQQIQKVAENTELTFEQKMEKRKELQQKIQDLQRQISQREMEIQQEAKEKAQKQNKPQENARKQEKGQQGGIDEQVMEGVIYAGHSMKEANTVSKVKIRMEGEKGVLAREIITDRERGGDTSLKENQMADLESRIDNAAANMSKKIGDSREKLEKGAETEAAKKEEEKEKEGKAAKSPEEEEADKRNGQPPIDVRL